MASAAAAVVAKARRDVVSHFMQQNAVSPAQAIQWVPDRFVKRRALARFVRQGVIIETGQDTFFLDVPAYDRWRRSMRKRLAVTLAGVAALGAVVAALV